MKPDYDYTIIGAGPAGMAAAVTAVHHGLKVLVLDEQQTPGGQIFRAIETIRETRGQDFQKLGIEYETGYSLVRQFRQCGADYLSGRTVWQLDRNLCVYHTPSDTSSRTNPDEPTCATSRRILIAGGAMERPLPFPGWTLPGVMAATAVDVLFKNSGMVPEGNVILAGSGPLLLLVACRLLDSGIRINAFLATTPRSAFLQAIPHLPGALRAPGYLSRGLAMKRKICRSGIPIHSGVTLLRALGDTQLEKVSCRVKGQTREFPADLMLLHQGVVPNVQLTRQLGCKHRWYELQRYWEPSVDQWGNTSIENVAVAGDCGRVSGAGSSETSGRLAALDTAYALGVFSISERGRLARSCLKVLTRHRAVRPFLDTLFRPSRELIVPPEETTILCRCEEVTVKEVREAVRMGAMGPNRMKSLIRSGMGPCQARMCGLSVSEVIADERGISPAEVGYFRVRSPIKPITLGQLAGINRTD